MKAEIDLTENRIFTTSRFSASREFENLKVLVEGFYARINKHPWDIRYWKDDFHEERPIFYTGSKRERMMYKEVDDSVSGEYCDRCGARLIKHPWSGEVSTLCAKCDSILKREHSGKRHLWDASPYGWIQAETNNALNRFW